MDSEILKKVLPKGILCGIAIALIVALVRMLIRGGGYTDHLFSVFGISSLICFPICWCIYFYNEAKKSKEKDGQNEQK